MINVSPPRLAYILFIDCAFSLHLDYQSPKSRPVCLMNTSCPQAALGIAWVQNRCSVSVRQTLFLPSVAANLVCGAGWSLKGVVGETLA